MRFPGFHTLSQVCRCEALCFPTKWNGLYRQRPPAFHDAARHFTREAHPMARDTPDLKKALFVCPTNRAFSWWGWRGSNPRPLRCERSALTSWATSPNIKLFYISLRRLASPFLSALAIRLKKAGLLHIILIPGVYGDTIPSAAGQHDFCLEKTVLYPVHSEWH